MLGSWLSELQIPGEDFARRIIEAIPAAIVVVAPDGRVAGVNAHFCEMLGFEAGAILGEMVEVLLPERFRHGHVALRAGFGREFRPRMMGGQRELYALHRDGHEMPVEAGLAPLLVGAEHYVIVSLADVTERRRLSFQAEWCRAIVDFSGEAIISKNPEGIVTSWNRKAEEIFGYRAEEMIGQSLLRLFPAGREVEEVQILERLARGQGISQLETVRQRKDGTLVDVSLTISPIFNERGEVVGASKIIHDIRERKRSEREIVRLNMELAATLADRSSDLETTRATLQDRTRERDDALGRVAHAERLKVEEERRRLSLELHDEIGQMLTALSINLEVVRRKCDTAALQPPLQNAIHITGELVSSVREIVHRLRPPQLDDLGLGAALRWHLERIRRTSFVVIQLIENLESRRFPAEVEMGCFRVVQESVTNVLRHASAHRVEVIVSCSAQRLVLCVRDDGIGFDPERNPEPDEEGGHLGLQGMRERVLGLGGRLQIDSAPGRGCAIRVMIPLPAEEVEA